MPVLFVTARCVLYMYQDDIDVAREGYKEIGTERDTEKMMMNKKNRSKRPKTLGAESRWKGEGEGEEEEEGATEREEMKHPSNGKRSVSVRNGLNLLSHTHAP